MKLNLQIKKLLDNWPSKIACFVIAILIYFFYQMSALDKKNISVPLSVKNDGNVVCVTDLPQFVRITLRAKSEDMSLIKDDDISAFIDISHYTKTDRYEVPIQIKLSANATVISPLEIDVAPDFLRLPLEEKAVNYVPLKPVFTGKILDGYVMESFTTEPELITITGPKNLVENTLYLSTSAIKIDGINKNTSQNIDIVNLSNYISVDKPKKITVNMVVVPRKIMRTIPGYSIFFASVNGGLKISTQSEVFSLKISGPEKALEGYVLTPYSIQVDCSKIEAPGVYELPLKAYLPQEFEVEDIQPQKISVVVEALTDEEIQAVDAEILNETENETPDNQSETAGENE